MKRIIALVVLGLGGSPVALSAAVKARLEPSANVLSGPDLVVSGNRYEHRLLGYDAPAIEAFSQNSAAYREMVAYSHGVTNSWISFGASVGILAVMPHVIGALKESQREFGRGALTTISAGGLAYSWYLGRQAHNQLLRAINIYNGAYDEKSSDARSEPESLQLAWSVAPIFDAAGDGRWSFPVAATLSF
jgi:hypothetical protein